MVLSAGDPERLRTAAQRLSEDLDEPVDLADLAYTTQLGREPLPERLAVVVASQQELKQALAQYVDQGSAVAVHLGNADEDAGSLSAVLYGTRGEEFLSALVSDGDLDRLAQAAVLETAHAVGHRALAREDDPVRAPDRFRVGSDFHRVAGRHVRERLLHRTQVAHAVVHDRDALCHGACDAEARSRGLPWSTARRPRPWDRARRPCAARARTP